MQPRNLALGKPTRQSTNMNSIQVSDNAVDGDLNNVYLSCTTTGYGDFTPYWLVDLEKTVEVHAVIITNRWDCCADRLKDFDVEIFAQDPVANPTAEAALCYHYTGPMAREPRNLALGKPTRQSTNMNSIQVSDNAVDGDLNNVYLSCTHTGYGDFTPYWLVDLEKTVEVHAVIITNRWDCCADRLKDFDVEIFAQDPVANPTAEAALCYHYTGPMARGM
nr:hypothetical protein BaRGS_011781 [Batillaria attramentaria]